MPTTTRVNYDELNIIAKWFRNEGEDYAQIISSTRQKVAALRTEWEGDAADKFFEEMDNVLLPALHRVSQGLIISQEVLIKVMKTVFDADQETGSYFKEVGGGGGGDDFGAGMFNSALDGSQGGASTGAAGDDFGAGTFGQAGDAAGAAGSPDSTDHFHVTGNAVDVFKTPEAETQTAAETPPATPVTPGAGGGGGGAGGGGSSGLQGDLQRLGAGLGGQPGSSTAAGGSSGGAQNLPDHNFGGSSGGGGGGGGATSAAGGAPGGGDTGGPSGNESLAAGIAGVAGSAAVGGAAKVLKGQQEQDGK